MKETRTILLATLLALATHLQTQTLVEAVDGKCSGTQRFTISIAMSFTPNIDPGIPQPNKAQIPILVAVMHAQNYPIFEKSKRLNDSVAEVASTGTASDLVIALEAARTEDKVSDYVILPESPDDDDIRVNAVVKFNLVAASDSSYLTIMAQLSPSPAWFVGLQSFELCRVKAESKTSYTYMPEGADIVLRNYNAGLDKGVSFEADPDPYEVGATLPVTELAKLTDAKLATMSFERTPSRFNWWVILLGVLLGITVVAGLVFLVLFILRRIRAAQDKEDIPLTSNERVEW